MSGWYLTDYFEPLDGDEEPERTSVATPNHLQTALSKFALLEPRIVILEGPVGQVFQIGVGGLWGGFACIDGIKLRIALPRVVTAPMRIEFLRWAQPCSLDQDELFPVGEMVDLLAGYMLWQEFSAWIRWRC